MKEWRQRLISCNILPFFFFFLGMRWVQSEQYSNANDPIVFYFKKRILIACYVIWNCPAFSLTHRPFAEICSQACNTGRCLCSSPLVKVELRAVKPHEIQKHLLFVYSRNKRLHQSTKAQESPGEQPSTCLLWPGDINQSDSSDGKFEKQ